MLIFMLMLAITEIVNFMFTIFNQKLRVTAIILRVTVDPVFSL